jgi:steroid delta-isomerase-like uncharacterized protein
MYPTLIHEWFEEIWTKGDAGAAHRLMAPEARLHNLAQDGKDSVGVAEFLDFFQSFRTAFPDTRIDVHETAREGDFLSGRWTFHGTHAGDGLGFPATHRQVSFEGMSFARMKDGQIVEGWNVWDAARMRDQLGFTSIPQGLVTNMALQMPSEFQSGRKRRAEAITISGWAEGCQSKVTLYFSRD